MKYRNPIRTGLLLATGLFGINTASQIAQAAQGPQPTICTRACWGARSASAATQMSALTRAIIHHTAGASDYTTDYNTGKAKVRGIQNIHMDSNGWSDIGYHFVVSAGGHIYEGRLNSISSLPRGAHDGNNGNSFGFNIMGNYADLSENGGANQIPTTASLNSLYDVIAWRMPSAWSPYGSGSYGGVTVGYLDGHRKVKATACPGNNIHNVHITSNYNGGNARNGVNTRKNGGGGGGSTTASGWQFTTGTDGWLPVNGTTGLGWINDASWPGIIYADQIGSDAYWFGPSTSFTGMADASVNVSVYPQSGSSANHDMKVYWKTGAENFMDEAKSSPTVNYVRQNNWIRLNLNCSSAKFSGQNVNQFRLDFDANNTGTRWIVNHIIAQATPKYWFGANTSGWNIGNGLSGFNWTGTGWPGVIYADQVGNDAFFYSPANLAYLGGANDQVVVRVHIQNANSSSHDMQLFWTTATDPSWTESKSTYVTYTLANGTWADIVLPVGANGNWYNGHIMQLRLDVDNIKKGNPRWLIDYAVVSHTTSSQ